MPSAQSPANSVDDVIVAPEPAPAPAGQAESDALLALSETLARRPDAAVQRLVEAAMKLTGADSAGVSLEEAASEPREFRWIATTGEFARYLKGTMPRESSPCGTVLDRGTPLVMRDPVRFYPSIATLHVPICSVLLAPFSRGGRLVGTVWVIAHTQRKQFSTQDLRVVQNLTTFATSILDTIEAKRS